VALRGPENLGEGEERGGEAALLHVDVATVCVQPFSRQPLSTPSNGASYPMHAHIAEPWLQSQILKVKE
jgi:hypothetical protein